MTPFFYKYYLFSVKNIVELVSGWFWLISGRFFLDFRLEAKCLGGKRNMMVHHTERSRRGFDEASTPLSPTD